MYGYTYGLNDLLALLIVLPAGYLIYSYVHKKSRGEKYFLLNLHYHLFFSIVYTVLHIALFGGGDTLAYFKTIMTLKELAWFDLTRYFVQIFEGNVVYQFTYETGRPLSWIFNEEESFFVCQLLSIFSFFCMNSILGFAIITGVISSITSWYFYRMVIERYNLESLWIALGCLFIPSVVFWCSGLSKDALVFNMIMILVFLTNSIIESKRRRLLKLIGIIMFSYFLINLRSVVFYCFLAPLVVMFGLRFIDLFNFSKKISYTLKTIAVISVLGSSTLFLDLDQSEEGFLASSDYLAAASMTQRDFARNVTYGANRYDLGNIEFTPLGLLVSMPKAIFFGIFSPFLWNSLTPTLFLNGLESVLFFYMLFLFIKDQFFKSVGVIIGDWFLLHCLLFVLMLSFVMGLTSVLYGVLVRLRAPVLPFFVIMLYLPNKIKSKLK